MFTATTQYKVHYCTELYKYLVNYKTASVVYLATDTEVSGSIPVATRFFWVVVGLERGLLSLVSLVRSTEELLEQKK